MKVTLDELQAALVDERITLGQFISVLVDNWGWDKTMKVIEHNIDIATKKEDWTHYEF